MKNLFFFALLFSAATCFAQKNTEGLLIAPKYEKTGVYSTSTTLSKQSTQANLAKVKKWLTGRFERQGEYKLTENKNLGILAGTGRFKVYLLTDKKYHTFRTNFQVDVNGKKYGIRFYDLALVDGGQIISERQLIMKGSKSVPVAQANVLVKKLSDELLLIMNDFQKAMEK